MISPARSATLPPAVKANTPDPRVIGYEILRRVGQAEVPDQPLDPHTERAVLGARDGRYLVPPGIDILELGLISAAGRFELLPIDANDKPLWDEVVHLLVTEPQAERQRGLLLRSYKALHAMIQEADELDAAVAEWSARGTAHPVFGMLRLEAIEVWKTMRHGTEPLSEPELDALHAAVARRVAAKLHAHVIR